MSHRDEQGQIPALPTWPAVLASNLGCLHSRGLRQGPKGAQGRRDLVESSYPHWAVGWSETFPPSPQKPPCSCADGAAEEEQRGGRGDTLVAMTLRKRRFPVNQPTKPLASLTTYPPQVNTDVKG